MAPTRRWSNSSTATRSVRQSVRSPSPHRRPSRRRPGVGAGHRQPRGRIPDFRRSSAARRHRSGVDRGGRRRRLRGHRRFGYVACGPPRSLRAQALSFTSEPMWKAWSQFVPTIRTGSTQAHLALGEDFFTYLGRHPEHGANFSAAMSSATAVWSDNITDVLDTSSVQCAVDVGGATGALLRRLQVANPR